MRIIKMFSTELKILITSRGNVIYQIPKFQNDYISHTPSYWSYSEKDGFRSICKSELRGDRDDGARDSSNIEPLQHKHQERNDSAYIR